MKFEIQLFIESDTVNILVIQSDYIIYKACYKLNFYIKILHLLFNYTLLIFLYHYANVYYLLNSFINCRYIY